MYVNLYIFIVYVITNTANYKHCKYSDMYVNLYIFIVYVIMDAFNKQKKSLIDNVTE